MIFHYSYITTEVRIKYTICIADN
uniref:Uncharacterized protein n=1 Tax=Arundo donax TaxID=35708 RepID=A0A0A9EHE2_ARUDO